MCVCVCVCVCVQVCACVCTCNFLAKLDRWYIMQCTIKLALPHWPTSIAIQQSSLIPRPYEKRAWDPQNISRGEPGNKAIQQPCTSNSPACIWQTALGLQVVCWSAVGHSIWFVYSNRTDDQIRLYCWTMTSGSISHSVHTSVHCLLRYRFFFKIQFSLFFTALGLHTDKSTLWYRLVMGICNFTHKQSTQVVIVRLR